MDNNDMIRNRDSIYKNTDNNNELVNLDVTNKHLDVINKHLEKVVNTFKAIGDETRLKIITLVMTEPLSVKSISEKIGMSQSAVSHQLHILKVNKIVKKERKGKETYYSLDDSCVKDIIETMYEHTIHHE